MHDQTWPDSGSVMVLSGASSSGKTSIVHALQEVLEPPYLEAGIDKFILFTRRLICSGKI
jgi:chloramphenicol 3-O-phosphotransferase